MATIILNLIVNSNDSNATVNLLNTAFNAVGDKWTQPTLVDFPIYFDGTFAVAPAIVDASAVAAVNAVINLIQQTDENDTEEVNKARRAISTLPKRIFVRSLYREQIIDAIDENGNTATKTYKVGGAFVEKLVALCPAGEVTAADLQTAITKAAKVGNSRKTVVAHADGFAKNSRGRKYQLIKYDLE